MTPLGRRFTPIASLALAALATAGCSSIPLEGRARIERALPEQARALPTAAIARATVHDDTYASIQLIRISEPIALHRHLQSEEIVYLLSGAGVLHLRGENVELCAGDLAVIPRNTPHGFTPTGAEPAVVLSTFVPPFIDGDRVMEAEGR
ncbi:MAG: cupin domain-containing protein [Planctomycetes bacterium]|nr:cupin domain-containing protein [Planctomycetota bacterium]